MFNFVFEINKKLNKSGYDFLNDLSKTEQSKFMNDINLKEMTEIERSYNQYLCQSETESFLKKLFYNIISLFGIVPFLIFCIIRYFLFRVKQNNDDDDDDINVAVFWGGDNTSIIPDSLNEIYIIKESKISFRLNIADMKFIYSELIQQHPFKYYFNMKLIFKIALYRENIEYYNPDCFIVTSEYSFTSSILTKYCNENGIIHINVMHGDKLYNKRDSFFKFDKCYVWDEHYKNLFISLMAYPNQFIIEVPMKFRVNRNKISIDDIKSGTSKLTYYLQSDNENDLTIIRDNLRIIKKNFNITVRPHPLYCDEFLIKQFFSEFNIENAKNTDINISINEADYVVSLYSTVLYQAYLQNKMIVVDDLIDLKYYNKLKELDYIIISKPHIKLSKLIESYF